MKKLFIFAISTFFLLSSCNRMDYDKTKSGVLYHFIKKGSGPLLGIGSFIKFNIKFTIPSYKDTVLASSFDHIPAYTPLDSMQVKSYSFLSVLPYCKEGSKVSIHLSIDTMVRMGMIQYNNMFTKGSYINCDIDVIKKFSTQETMFNDFNTELAKEKQKEVNEIADYLAQNHIKADSVDGIFYVITKPGTGPFPDTSKAVVINYTGSLLSNSTIFDSNIDTNFHHATPFVLAMKSPNVISGWVKAIPKFNKGSRGTIYIPAMSGYGMQGAPPKIPGYSNLKFDIDVLDVRDTVIALNPMSPFGAMGGMHMSTPPKAKENQQKDKNNKKH